METQLSILRSERNTLKVEEKWARDKESELELKVRSLDTQLLSVTRSMQQFRVRVTRVLFLIY